jgi:two-component system, OmpR family, heavy metal sensor histidine kinase CusS
MKSIRLSLMVYFLGLLAVALLVASLLVYRTAERTLAAKEKATAELIEAQHRELCREEEKRLDVALETQAKSLARLVQVQFDRFPAEQVQPNFLLGMLSTSLSPSGYALAPAWIVEAAPALRPEPPPRSEGPPSPEALIYFEVRRHLPFNTRQLKFDKMLLPGEGQVGDYFQIDSPPGKSYHSLSMGDHSFPLNLSAFDPDQVFQSVFDNTALPPETPVRRVVLRASGVGTVFTPSGPRSRPRSSREPPPARPRAPRQSPPSKPAVHRGPTIYIQCAAETHKRDAALAALAQRRDDDLAAVAAKTDESLRELRLWLWAIGAAVFAATGIGSFWLVRLGLSPLHRLSDAVSRVSVKDFRLPLDERPLPLELQPITQRLSSTLDLLKRAFAREKQASADISHELRTPLAALLTTTELGLRKPRSPEQYRELMNDCHTSAQQMNQIVERLLTLARLDAGVDRLRVQTIDAAALAQQCAAVVRPLAEASGLQLTIDRPCAPSAAGNGDGACLVQIDSDKLREVVSNLLHNAIQYNQPGGSVGLRVARANGSLEVEVRDTGIGIAPEAREHIFERFYRADPSRGCDEPHAGLGLAIVKEYIDLMGGSIGVESVEGQGSTFRVRLPVHEK